MLRLRWDDPDFVLRDYFVERSLGDMIEGSIVVGEFNLSENVNACEVARVNGQLSCVYLEFSSSPSESNTFTAFVPGKNEH